MNERNLAEDEGQRVVGEVSEKDDGAVCEGSVVAQRERRDRVFH